MKAFFVLCFAVVAFEATNAQVIRSIAPGIISNNGCGCGCNSIAPVLAPISPCGNNFIAPISPCASNIISPISPCGNNIISPCSSIYSDIVSPISVLPSNIIAAPAPISSTIIQQPSVAANLADTLSLLTVSSLLAETLPLSSNVLVAPPCGLYGNYGGYLY